MKRSSFAVVLMLAIFAGVLQTTLSNAQAPVIGPGFTLVILDKSARADRKDTLCKYFVWTKNFSTDQRVGFVRTTADKMMHPEVPLVTNVTIVITPDDAVPVANRLGTDEYRRDMWQISMSHDTFDKNKGCLGGIAVTNAAANAATTAAAKAP